MPYTVKRILIGVVVAVGAAFVITTLRVLEAWPS